MRLSRSLGLRAALAAAGSAAAGLAASPARAKEVPGDPPETQWLFTFDGTTLRRDKSGRVLYFDAAGEELPARPEHVPAEAYAQRYRPGRDATEPLRPNKPVRHVLLIRHSQDDLDGRTDALRTLTPFGEQQAALLAKRLAEMHASTSGAYAAFALETVLSSELTRARQTADIITGALPDAARLRDGTLNEGRPCLPEPPPRHASHYTNRHGDSERIEGAFRRICARPCADQQRDSYHLVVCHANVIRYFVCRALVCRVGAEPATL
jgi:broad specificity phosphatase PhoE